MVPGGGIEPPTRGFSIRPIDKHLKKQEAVVKIFRVSVDPTHIWAALGACLQSLPGPPGSQAVSAAKTLGHRHHYLFSQCMGLANSELRRNTVCMIMCRLLASVVVACIGSSAAAEAMSFRTVSNGGN